MAKQALFKVIEAEKLYNKKLEDEKKVCELKIEVAKKQAEKIVETAKVETNKFYEEKVKNYSLSAALENKSYKRLIDEKCEKLEKMFQENLEKAIESISKEILKI